MPKTAAQKYLEGLADDTYLYTNSRTGAAVTVATLAADRLYRAREATVEAVTVKLLAGVPLAPSAVRDVVNQYYVEKVVRERIKDPLSVLINPATPLQQLLIVGWAHGSWRGRKDPNWQALRQALRDRLKLGLIENPDDLRWLAKWAANTDRKLSVDLLAHSTYQPPLEDGSAVTYVDLDMWDDVAKRWPLVMKRRQKLITKRWLPAIISPEEYAETRDLNREMLLSLYPGMVDGYAQYRTALAGRAAEA